MTKRFLTNVEVANTGTLTIQSPAALRSPSPANLSVTPASVSGTVAQTSGFNPFGKYLWHDLLGFGRSWGVPLYETKTSGGVWSTSTNANAKYDLFAQKEDQAFTLIDGVADTAVRWTWGPSGNVSYSMAEWFVFGFTYNAQPITRDILIESSTDGSAWTTRHTTTGNSANAAPTFCGIGTAAIADNYYRVTITHTNGQPLLMSTIKALSARWGNQGRGSEFEYPYQWDAYNRLAIGGSAAHATAALLVQPTVAASNPGLIVKGMASQTGNLQQWQNSAGTVQSYVDATGGLYGPVFASVAQSGSFLTTAAAGPLTATAGGAAIVGLVVQAAVGQTANVQEWRNAAGATAAYIVANAGTMVLSGNLTVNQNITVGGTASVGVVTLTAKGVAAQTADLQQWQNSGSTALTRVAADGSVYVPDTTITDPARGLRVTTPGGTNLLSFQGLDYGGVTYAFFSTNRTYGVGGWTGTGWHGTRAGASLQLNNETIVLYQFPASSNTPTVSWLVDHDKNMGLGTQQFGSGAGVIGLLDATTVPTTNPVGGGVLYSEAGALKWREPSGTVRVFGSAGTENVFVQAAAPSSPPSTYMWVQTGLGDGSGMTFWVEDGS